MRQCAGEGKGMGSERQHYGAIDGLRTIAAIGIVMMHVKANNEYEEAFLEDTAVFCTAGVDGHCHITVCGGIV